MAFFVHGPQQWVSAKYKHTLGGVSLHFCVLRLQRNFVMLSQSEGLNHVRNTAQDSADATWRHSGVFSLVLSCQWLKEDSTGVFASGGRSIGVMVEDPLLK